MQHDQIYPDIARFCHCGAKLRVVSARKLLAGKRSAAVIVRCSGCDNADLIRLRRDEREAFVRRSRFRVVA